MTQYEIPYPETIANRNHEQIPFDPVGNATHRKFLDRVIAKWKTLHPDAQDAQVDVIDEDRRMVILHSASVASVKRDDAGAIRVNLLPEQCKPNKGREVAAAYERKFPGFHLTEFHPYESTALLERMSDRELTARGLVCEYVGCDPWNVKVKEHDHDEGFSLSFLAPFVFKKDVDQSKLDGAAVAIGHVGWWSRVDARTGEGDIIPGEPPTFPETVPFDFDALHKPGSRDRAPFGVKPARPGETAETAFVDWTQSPGLLVAGLSGGGKSVTVNDIIASGVAAGVELYLVDHVAKASDFNWVRPWVAPHGWGADSLLQACGLLKRLLDDISDDGARTRAWREHGWQNWYDDLSDEDKREYPLRLIVVDELSQIAVGGKDASAIPKNPLPAVMERMIEQQVIALNLSSLIKISQIGRAYGYRLIVATQLASSTTGMPPALRGNLGNKLIMGARANPAQRKLIFNDASSVPTVPTNVFDEGVSKGVGVAEFEGQEPFVFKSAFPLLGRHAGTAALGEALVDLVGLPDGFTRDEYLSSLDKSTPVNADYERRIRDRVAFDERDTYRLYPFLRAMKDKLDEVSGDYDDGGGGPAAPSPTPVKPDKTNPSSGGAARSVPSEGLLDARELARVMEGRD